MSKKKIIFDLIFIVVSAICLIVLNEFGLIEKYVGFSFLPIIIAYFLGQLVERKTRTKSE